MKISANGKELINLRRWMTENWIISFAVTGSRELKDSTWIDASLREIVKAGDGDALMFNGGAVGADELFRTAWTRMGGHVRLFKPDYRTYGRTAPLERNSLMISENPGLLLATPTPNSRGTWDTITKAENAGIPVFVFEGV